MFSPSRSHGYQLPTQCLPNQMLMREGTHKNSQHLARDALPGGEGPSYASFVVMRTASAWTADFQCC